MNWDTMLNVGMSMVFFAPLLIALGLFLFMGVLVVFEAVMAVGNKYAGPVPVVTGEAAALGPIAVQLEEAIRGEGKAGAEAEEKGAEHAANE